LKRFFQSHPDPTLQKPWNCVQLGLWLLPFSALLGGISILIPCLWLWKQRFSGLSRRSINRGFALLAVLVIVTAWVALDRPVAFLGLFNFLPFFLVFAALSELIQTTAQLRRIAWIFVLTSIPMSLIGLAQLLLQWGGHLSLLWSLIEWKIDPGGTPLGRMASVLSYANVLANYAAIVLILGIGLWLETMSSKGARHRSLPWFLGSVIAIDAIVLILTNSRNAWIVAFLACLAFALYQGWRLVVGVVVAIAGIVLGAAFAPSPISQPLRQIVPAFFWARVNDQMFADRPIAMLRSTQWQVAWEFTQQRPFTGWGLRNFTALYQAKMGVWLGHPHSLFLMLSAETGLIATLLLSGLVGWILLQGVRHLQMWKVNTAIDSHDRRLYFSFLLAFLACSFFHSFDVILFDARINTMGWLVLAALWGVVLHTGQPIHPHTETHESTGF
jgi:O-antigen ligase